MDLDKHDMTLRQTFPCTAGNFSAPDLKLSVSTRNSGST